MSALHDINEDNYNQLHESIFMTDGIQEEGYRNFPSKLNKVAKEKQFCKLQNQFCLSIDTK